MASISSNQMPPLAAGTENALFPPSSTNWLAAIRPSLTYLMISSTMGSIELVMLFAMLFFSTAQIRRKPIFIVNILAISLGIAGAILIGFENIHSLLSPEIPQPHGLMILFGAFDSVTPILVGTILLLRLYAVFPPSRTSRTKFVAIMALPVLLKIGRFVNIAIYLTNLTKNMHSLVRSDSPVGAGVVLVTSKLPDVKIAWFLQVFDDAYSSLAFLIRLHGGSKSGSSQTTTQYSTSAFGQRLKTLFWISVTNFVFPVILSVTQLAVYMSSSSNYLLALYVDMANVHVTIVGVVFATVWATADRRVYSEPTITNSMFVARGISAVTDTSGAMNLALSEPCEGHAWSDDGKVVDLRSRPGHLEANMGHSGGPLGIAV